MRETLELLAMDGPFVLIAFSGLFLCLVACVVFLLVCAWQDVQGYRERRNKWPFY